MHSVSVYVLIPADRCMCFPCLFLQQKKLRSKKKKLWQITVDSTSILPGHWNKINIPLWIFVTLYGTSSVCNKFWILSHFSYISLYISFSSLSLSLFYCKSSGSTACNYTFWIFLVIKIKIRLQSTLLASFLLLIKNTLTISLSPIKVVSDRRILRLKVVWSVGTDKASIPLTYISVSDG